MIASLTFDAATHTYRYEDRLVPGVTSVLEPLQMLQGVPWAVLEAARKFGSNVHLACHLFNVGMLDIATLDPALLPYLEGWQAFLADTGFDITESESPVYNAQLKYAGTPDCIGNYAGSTWVVDIKSGVVPCTVGLQLAAYQHAKPVKPKRRLCVQLTGAGKYKLHEQKNPGDFALFMSALNIHNFLQKRKPVDVNEYA